jgi:hypothetical protein
MSFAVEAAAVPESISSVAPLEFLLFIKIRGAKFGFLDKRYSLGANSQAVLPFFNYSNQNNNHAEPAR